MTPENPSPKPQSQSNSPDSCCDNNCSCHHSDRNLVKVLSVLVIICLIAIIALTYLLLRQPQLTQNKQLSLKPKATPSTLDVELKENSDTSNWQTYTNEEYDFSFRYPSALFLNDNTSRIIVLENFNNTDDYLSKNDKFNFKLEIRKFEDLSNYTSFEDWVSYEALGTEKNPSNIKEYITTSIDQKKAYKKTQTTIPGIFNSNIETVYHVEYKNYLYTFSFIQDNPDNLENSDLFDQILSTFKFIEKEQLLKDGSYKNEKFGFEFQCPSSWEMNNNNRITNIAENHELFIDAVLDIGFGYCFKYEEDKEIEVDGKSAITADGLGIENSCQGTKLGFGSTFVLIPLEGYDPNRKVLLEYSYPITDKELAKSNLDQILSTFKFTNQ